MEENAHGKKNIDRFALKREKFWKTTASKETCNLLFIWPTSVLFLGLWTRIKLIWQWVH